MGSAIKSIGAGVSGVMSMIGGKKDVDANKEGLRTQREFTERGADEMRLGREGAVADYQPYRELSLRALANLQSANYGGPQQYTDQNGVMQTTTYSPQESEGFKFIKQNTLRDLDRYLRARGRSNSTYGMNAMGRTIGELNAQNEQQQYGRMGDLIQMGQFGTQGAANARYGTGGSLGSLYSNLGSGQAAGYRSLGQARSKMWNDGAKWNYQSASDGGDAMDDWLSMGGGGFGG